MLACASTHAPTSQQVRSPSESMYHTSQEQIDSGLYTEAIATLRELKNKHPYSREATLVDLRSADIHFGRDEFVEAIASYQEFVNFHPNHEETPYALQRIGDAHFEQIPSNWFFLPPRFEKDQQHVMQAAEAYQSLLARFQNYKKTEQVREQLRICRGYLAEHEYYVVKFYMKRKQYRAALSRSNYLLANFPQSSMEPQVLKYAIDAALEVRDVGSATQSLKRLIQEYPQVSDASWARAKLEEIRAEIPAAAQETDKNDKK